MSAASNLADLAARDPEIARTYRVPLGLCADLRALALERLERSDLDIEDVAVALGYFPTAGQRMLGEGVWSFERSMAVLDLLGCSTRLVVEPHGDGAVD